MDLEINSQANEATQDQLNNSSRSRMDARVNDFVIGAGFDFAHGLDHG